MPPRSRCLVAPTLLAGPVAQLLYTAPAGRFVLLHSIRIVNADTVDQAVTIGYADPPSDAPLLYDAVVQPNGVLVDQSWQVMPEAAELWAEPAAGGVLYVSVNGAVLGP